VQRRLIPFLGVDMVAGATVRNLVILGDRGDLGVVRALDRSARTP